MAASEIFRTSEASAWKKYSKLNNCNILVQMLPIQGLSNRFAHLPSKTACISATLYRVTITMDLKHRDITLASNRFSLKSICKLLTVVPTSL
jgi:hypothetical protein